MSIQHKVGNFHHYGRIVSDSYKYDMSGNTVTMYESKDKSTYNIVEWNQTGEYEISVKSYDNEENAVIAYVELTWGITAG